jgi:hypothetical protein
LGELKGIMNKDKRNTIMLISFLIFISYLLLALFLNKIGLLDFLLKYGWFNSIFRILFVIAAICCFIAILILNFDGIYGSFLTNILLFTIFIVTAGYTSWFKDYKTTVLGSILSIITYILWAINLIIFSYQISTQRKPQKLNLAKLKLKRHPGKFLNIINEALYKYEVFMYRISIIAVPVLYIILVLTTVLAFGVIYEQYNIYGKGETGLFYNAGVFEPKVIKGWDVLYFRTVTFFTVGFGDVVPKGDNIKLLVQLEIAIGFILNVVYLPIIFSLFTNRLQNTDNRNKNEIQDKSTLSIKKCRKCNKRKAISLKK